MTKITLPNNLDTEIWASGGSKTAPTTAKYSTGWLQEIPSPEDENYIQGRQDTAIANIVQNGIPEWNTTITYNRGSLSIYSGIIVTSLTNNNIGNTPTISAGASDPNWTRIDQYRDQSVQSFADSSLRYCIADSNSVVLNKDFSNVGTVTNTTKAGLASKLATIDGTANTLAGYNSNGSLVINKAVTGATAADSVIVGVGNDSQELRGVTLDELVRLLGVATPVGTVITYAGATGPQGYFTCDGRSLNRTSYPNLFNVIGTLYGSNSSTTFNIPDLRGIFVRGYDSGKGVDKGRALGSFQDDAIRNITGSIGDTLSLQSASTLLASGSNGAFSGNHVSQRNIADTLGTYTLKNSPQTGHIFNASNVVPTAEDNRPKNIAMAYLIKF